MVKKFINEFGWPRIIILLFLISQFVIAPFFGIRLDTSISDTLIRLGMNGILVLSLLPMVQGGTGLNFGLPLGVVAGLLGSVCSLEIGATGFLGFFTAIGIAVPIAIIVGIGYGLILNKIKGGEMMIATYVGFSSVAFMGILWILLPFKAEDMIWAYGGSGLRTTISVENYWFHILNNILPIKIGTHFVFPTGMFIFFGIMCFLVWLFFRTRTGTAMTAAGSNMEFARASGVNVDKMRIISVVLSTVLAAIGIIVYQQSFGFIQLYQAPLFMAFPAVAALLIGGASVNKATIFNVILGAFLFQGILTMTPSVMVAIVKSDMSETIRLIISNGMILYALTRVVRRKK